MDKAAHLDGLTKSAVFLVSLGVDTASQVLAQLEEKEVEKLSIAISYLKGVPADTVRAVFQEYLDLGEHTRIIGTGGAAFARQAVASALGDEQAEAMLSKMEKSSGGSAFQMLNKIENSQLAGFLQSEHPQTAALILSHVSARKSAEVVALLPDEQREEVVFRLATMGKTSPALMNEIEGVLREQVGSVLGAELSTSGGVELVAEILNYSARATERSIMDGISERDPILAGGIKALMFTFDDLIKVSGRDLQKLLSQIDQRDLILALKGSQDELKNKLMGNVSERAAQAITEELELLGPVKLSEIEEAQRRIIEEAQNMEEREEISLGRESADELVL
ncbi:MAG: flagellar motor switch protein FliG [Rhodothermales bacterium]|nr:flagellar motor switch protein FliG [Rhodothermales bacterium]MBO6780459.1 flagellar motor switch protein FliG [Rhodothermales bacterium]